ncbi:peptidase domain-containing ABC transporter [Dinghuibacter silviterrae]|uniref:ATP-binding cassette subfamily B protein n=1 Tax=Dinghuibacter silviterrae TaxID=1539049 RepID=A0A4R8DGS2_9BACT|nr:peptidase domain-containing ABC transporter [Dinghuibacter silviterrae]TDW96667.1 ATP-binding cassette subfamily B protein [Dinghuibacter silviterrae]
MAKFPFYQQFDDMDCGPACLRIITRYYGKSYSMEYIRSRSFSSRVGVSLLGLSDASEALGMRSLSITVGFDVLKKEAPLPCIAHWRQRHFIVVYKVTNKHVYVSDPAFGLLKYSHAKFLEGWLYNQPQDGEGVLLLLEPAPAFYEADTTENDKKNDLFFLYNYVKPYRRFGLQLLAGLVATGIIQFLLPFLTQSVVDYGINTQNLQFIYIVLLGQLMLFFSQTVIGVLRSWILVHAGSRINMAILSDFLLKLLKLPMTFFDSRSPSDIMQRIEDTKRVENFLSSITLNAVFSFFTLLVFGTILAFYNFTIFLIFFVATVLYIVWILLFVKQRAILDYKRYDEARENKSSILQLINGIAEIKLNNSEKRRRWEWEAIQTRLFKISLKSVSYNQLQVSGSAFINELKNIIILVIAATEVIRGQITLGMMLAIQYILGQLNAPVSDFITFLQNSQDARLSLSRLAEIHRQKESGTESSSRSAGSVVSAAGSGIRLTNVSFQYGGPQSHFVLRNINLDIPGGKITAVVGASGSGKTSLLKLILKLYSPTKGNIQVGAQDLDQLDTPSWRRDCGTVMQNGYIFADTLGRNIAESSSDGSIDPIRLKEATNLANLRQLVDQLPMGYQTNLSWDGISLSGGELQRILIARAIYKNPAYLFFDEATSSLDANNEKEIMAKLYPYYEGRTVLIIAHRLSTVKHADKIVVLNNGEIVEEGNHEELVVRRGKYFELVRNQLELGN